MESRTKKITARRGLTGILRLMAGTLLLLLPVSKGEAQIGTGQDMQQLILDIEKLTQFKAILADMRQGYSMLTQGYRQVKDLSQGNFNLHAVFLNGLLQVNPEVAKYARVADIIADEVSILSEYRNALKRLRNSGLFHAGELGYLSNVYGRLTAAALNDVNDLADVVTASRLRMSDDERLAAIDRIYASSSDKLAFLRSFNRRAGVLAIQRQQEQMVVNNLKSLYP